MPCRSETIRGIATPTTVWSSAASRSAMATPSVARITWERDVPWVMPFLLSSGLVCWGTGYWLLRNVCFLNRIQPRNQDAEHLGAPAAGSDPSRVPPGLVRRRPGGAAGGQHADHPQRHGPPPHAGLSRGCGLWGGRRLQARRRLGPAAAPARRRGGGGGGRGAAVIDRGRGGRDRGNVGPAA